MEENGRTMYEFLFEDHIVCFGEDAHVANTNMDERRLMNTKNLLEDSKNTFVETIERNGTVVASEGEANVNQVNPIGKSSSTVLARAKEKDKENDKEGCGMKVQVTMGKRRGESLGEPARKNGEGQSVENDKAHAVEKQCPSRAMKL